MGSWGVDTGPPPLLAVVGATATGKTELAAALAVRLDAEVLSCDASCVYRGLDVGTAKPDPELRARVPHHLIDVCEPAEEFTAARWLTLAERLLEELARRDRPAVLAGGTGLYLRLLLRGLADSPEPDEALRERLESRERRRPGSLHRLLRRLDPALAARTPPARRPQLVRALEHRLGTGRRLSEDQVEWARAPRREAVKIGLRLDRDLREERIRSRVDLMLAKGLVAEVEALLSAGLSPSARSMRAIGYREVVAHLRGGASLEEVRERIVVATRRYAKRQDTWFRKEPGIAWFDTPGSARELPALVDRVMMTLPPSLLARARTESPPEQGPSRRTEEPRP